MPTPIAWVVFTIVAAAAQTIRNAVQRGLTLPLGTTGATLIRFLFGVPFAIASLIAARTVTGAAIPAIGANTMLWAIVGAATQVAATALMLAAMRDRSFVVTIAYTKTETVQIAIYGLVILGDRLSPLTILAILLATAGVMIMSWPRRDVAETFSGRAIGLGLLSGACFALSAIGFRAAILSLSTHSFVMAATTTLVLGLSLQAAASLIWLCFFDRKTLHAIARNWVRSLSAGLLGALASQFWFLGFAIASAAQVRTLGLVEVLFAQLVSRRFMNEGVSRRELAGVALIAVGVALIINV